MKRERLLHKYNETHRPFSFESKMIRSVPGFLTSLFPLESATKTTPPIETSRGGGRGARSRLARFDDGGSEDRSIGVAVPLLEDGPGVGFGEG